MWETAPWLLHILHSIYQLVNTCKQNWGDDTWKWMLKCMYVCLYVHIGAHLQKYSVFFVFFQIACLTKIPIAVHKQHLWQPNEKTCFHAVSYMGKLICGSIFVLTLLWFSFRLLRKSSPICFGDIFSLIHKNSSSLQTTSNSQLQSLN